MRLFSGITRKKTSWSNQGNCVIHICFKSVPHLQSKNRYKTLSNELKFMSNHLSNICSICNQNFSMHNEKIQNLCQFMFLSLFSSIQLLSHTLSPAFFVFLFIVFVALSVRQFCFGCGLDMSRLKIFAVVFIMILYIFVVIQ